MSTFYREDNEEKADDLWIKKQIYMLETEAMGLSTPNLVNFNAGEKFLYGRVSRLFVPMTVRRLKVKPAGTIQRMNRPASTIFSPIKQTADANSNIKALNFVVQAFDQVSFEFKRAAAKQQIDANDQYLSELVVTKAYEDPHRYYEIYKKTYFSAIAQIMTKNNVKSENFQDFVTNLLSILQQTSESVPFTFGSFVKSRRCPINVSGLAIEIATIKSSDDQKKIDLFINSPNWQFYLNACNQHGFMVDRSEPWRLVADIGSPQMLSYAARYTAEYTDKIISEYYVPCYGQYFFGSFVADLLSLYNLCTIKPILQSELCGAREIMTTKYSKQYANIKDLRADFLGTDFLKLYCQLRLIEEETPYTDAEIQKLMHDTMQFVDNRGSFESVHRALDFFEQYTNKPFDYRGSLTYNNN